MDKLKIAGSFLKIKFHNIFSVIVKAATGYIVGSFATIQLSSIVVDNVSTQAIIGMPSETFYAISLYCPYCAISRCFDNCFHH